MGDKLGKTFDEIAELSPDEFVEWLAYYKIQGEEERAALKRSRNK